jgi:hypothetical protein
MRTLDGLKCPGCDRFARRAFTQLDSNGICFSFADELQMLIAQNIDAKLAWLASLGQWRSVRTADGESDQTLRACWRRKTVCRHGAFYELQCGDRLGTCLTRDENGNADQHQKSDAFYDGAAPRSRNCE